MINNKKMVNFRNINKIKNNKKKTRTAPVGKRGFSLVEMLVALFIFSLVMMTVVSVFASFVSNRKKIGNVQRDLENGRTAIELMAKNIRMSCGVGIGYVSSGEETTGSALFMYNNSQGKCLIYQFQNGNLKSSSAPIEAPPGSENEPCPYDCRPVNAGYSNWKTLVSSNIQAGEFRIVKTDREPASVDGDPRVVGKATILMSIGADMPVTLQTTVSHRDYEELAPN
ncbi:MAG TPA: prepilin-type N-terminal cleavage/methylation domain-containing protein [Candidatus Moranbacteria bacterium]|nr:prepilin-type N-terminal cleavage/methylation domain-containing protein [Candidatus Moranbacteria bacterium]